MPESSDDFAARTGVSRETLARLQAFGELLTEWNARYNLVSKNSLGNMWGRHFRDCAQLAPLIPSGAASLADLGSGAGFPGLVLAAMRPDLQVTLYEATAKKCAFLAAAAARMGISVGIENVRMEDAASRMFDVVTSRACAPLSTLLSYAQKFLSPNSVCLFLKGQNVEFELTEAHKSWNMKTGRVTSLTDPSGVILELTEVAHVRTPKTAHPSGSQPKGRRR